MSKSFWLFIFSFILWIPLGYIVFHRFDVEEDSPHPLTTGTAGEVKVTAPNKLSRIQAQIPVQTDMSIPITHDKLHHKVNRYDKGSIDAEYSTGVRNRSAADFKSKKGGVAWSEFIKLPKASMMEADKFNIPSDLNLIECSSDVEQALKKPGLSEQDYRWCEWALSPSGGAVQVSTTP